MEQKNHRFLCDGRKFLQIFGVEKVESNNLSQVVCMAMNTTMIIVGKNLHIKKLDIQEGILEIDGTIDQVKYQGEKKSFWKRIFK